MALAVFAIEGKCLQKKLKIKPTKEIENYCALRKKNSFCSENFDLEQYLGEPSSNRSGYPMRTME